MTPGRLLVASVGLGLVLLATGCDSDSAPRTSSATSSATSSSASTSGPTLGYTGWVAGLPVGPPPAVGYVVGHTYHSSDGRLVRLPRDRGTTAIAGIGDGFLVVDDRNFEATAGVALLDARGHTVRDLGYMTGAPVLSADGTTLRWITFTPSEFGPHREPTRLYVADVGSGAIDARVIHRPGEIRPVVPQRAGIPAVRVQREQLVVSDYVTGTELARYASPGPWTRGRTGAATWEDRAPPAGRDDPPECGTAAVVRLDTRTGAWSLAVDWMPTQGTFNVTFETHS